MPDSFTKLNFSILLNILGLGMVKIEALESGMCDVIKVLLKRRDETRSKINKNSKS